MSDLYAAVDRSPGALAPRLVLADWLQTRGDPRGQLGVAQHALAVDPDDVAMRAQVGRMLREHPDLAPSLPVFDEEPEYLDVRWRIGFVDRLVVRVCPWFEWDEAALADAVEALVSHEGCRFLRELVVLVEEWPGRGRNAEAALMRARARRPSLQSTVAGALVESGTTDLDGLDASRLRWVTAAPEEIAGRASELVHLEYLRLVTDRTSLPEALGELPALRRLDLAGCAGLRSIPAAVLTIPTLQAIRTYGCDGLSACGYSMARIDPALAGWARVNASRERRRVELDLLLGRTPDATVEDLLRALDSNVTAIRRTALQVLAERLAPADLEGEVALAGSFDARTGELKLLLQESGSTVRSRPTAKTRWVVVGEKPKGAQLAARAAGRGLALERDVLALREAGHAEAPPDVLADLRSRDPARTTAALDALKHGRLDGLHVTEVLAVSQDTALPAGVRKAAKKLFSISADDALQAAVAKHFAQSVLSSGEDKRRKRILDAARRTSLDPVAFATALFVRSGLGWSILKTHGTPAQVESAFRARVQDGVLDLSDTEITWFPACMADLGVTTLRLARLPIAELPPVVSAMHGLRVLDLERSPITALPDLSAHTALEELDLHMTAFRSFPEAVRTAPALRVLRVGTKGIRALPKWLDALEALEELDLHGFQVASLPDGLFRTGLRSVRLSSFRMPPPDARVTRWTSLEQLDVYASAWDTVEHRESLAAWLPGVRIVGR